MFNTVIVPGGLSNRLVKLQRFHLSAYYFQVAFCHLLRHKGAKEIYMPQSVKLSDELIKQARHYGDVYHRSTAKQIEYWSTIGKISEENPDLPYSFIKNILLAQREVRSGDVTPYEFG
ncbi:MAG: ParD-like family protein [Yoonia sp.]|nr:ParD-like family protein [Yoonia sp.]